VELRGERGFVHSHHFSATTADSLEMTVCGRHKTGQQDRGTPETTTP